MFDGMLAVGFTGNDRGCPPLAQPEPQSIAVISFIADEILRRRHRIDGEHGDFDIMHVTRGQQEDMRPPFVVADGMELGVAASFGRADTMSQGPPFAPPAVR